MKVENKKILNICLVVILVALLILLLLMFMFGRTLSKYNRSVSSNSTADIAKPVFVVDGEQNIKIDGIQDTEYDFSIKNYNFQEISDVDMDYTIEIVNSSKANLSFELIRNGTKVSLDNNKTDTFNLKGIQRHTDDYKLIVKYENDATILEDITGNVQIKVEAVQSEVI